MKTIGDIFFEKTNPPAGVTSNWASASKKNAYLDDVFMTIDLIFASGKIVRISTDHIEVKDGTERVIGYTPALESEAQIVTSYSFENNSAQVRTFALTVDGRHIKPVNEILTGHPLCGYAEISLQRYGDDIKDRFLLMRGEMVGGVVFANDEEFVEIEISDPKLGNELLMPQPIADTDAFPTIPSDYNGQRFPQIFHSYDYIPAIRLSSYQNGPSFLVAQGHDFNVDVVYVDGEVKPSTDATRGWSAEYRYSNNGIPYTAVDFVYTTNLWDNESVYVAVSSNKERNIFQIMQDILVHNSNLGVDGINYGMITRSQSKAPFLSANCMINASDSRSLTSAIGYIENTICQSFPMLTPCFTGFGFGVVYTDRTYQNVTTNLVLEQNLIFGRLTSITEKSKEDLYNEFTIKYSYNAITDNYEKTLTINSSSNSLCAISENKIGKRSMPPIESVIIYDDVSAQAVINWLANHLTLPSYYVEYEGTPALFFTARLGDVITLTDHKLDFKDEKCTVEKITYERGRSIIGLRIWVLYRTVYN